jgi:hypothetical protein
VERKEIVIGFGHPVYTIADPRNPIIKEISRKLCEDGGNQPLFDVSERIESLMWDTEEDVPQPRLVQRVELPHDGRADRDVHAAVRDRAHQRLERAHDRAAPRTARSSARARITTGRTIARLLHPLLRSLLPSVLFALAPPSGLGSIPRSNRGLGDGADMALSVVRLAQTVLVLTAPAASRFHGRFGVARWSRGIGSMPGAGRMGADTTGRCPNRG